MEAQELMNEIKIWTDEAFKRPEGKATIAPIHHLKKEVVELIEELTKFYNEKPYWNHRRVKEEYADCFMLILTSASNFGLTMQDLIDVTEAKLKENKKFRKWGEPDNNGVVEHIKY